MVETEDSLSNIKPERNESDHVPFQDNYYLIVTPHLNQAIYTFYNPDNKKSSEYTGVEPLKLTELTIVGREIKKHLNPENRLNNDAVSKDFEYVKMNLQSKYDSAILDEENKRELEELKNQEYIQERLKEAKIVLESKDMPLLYIASLVSWLTAGERNNIMLTFIAYASQVILKNPISVIVLGEGGSGKALDLNTEIPTPNGFTLIKDLKVGDNVFDENGRICEVTHKSPVFYDHDCYEISFDDGCKIVADADHRWKVLSHYQRDKKLDGSVLDTKELFKTHKLKKGMRWVNNYAIEIPEPLQLPDKKLPIDPYILGLWLGDGHTHDAHFTTKDYELLDTFEKYGYELHPKKHDEHTWNVLGLFKPLRLNNLLHNKHIPKSYFRASYHQRLSLVQGLMDTDGHVDKKGNCEFTQKKKEIIKGLSDLLKTLGIKTRIKPTYKKATNAPNSEYKKYYILHFTTNLPVFRLPRKLERIKEKIRKTQERKYITSVKPIKSVPTQCIAVNSPSKLFLCGRGCIPTHNTHIETTAMSLIPSQFIKHEKSITEAAMFNRAKDDPHYYDGCIVNYGDLGGRNSQDFVMEAKNLLKELQSDGFLNKPLNVPTPEGWEVKDIMLKGKPCLTYTTVPGFVFDDQELSRSIFITPRMDNKAVFNARKQIIELKHGKTYHLLQKYKKDIEITQYMVYLLREHMENITIINPYTDSVIKFLGESEYFKRDFDKYNGILKTITAFHSFNRPTFELGNKTVLFTSLRDIQLFISLLKAYHESISVNISPKAAEVLEIIRENWADWLLDKKIGESGLTTNQYFELAEPNISKRSVRRYFGELNNAGFLKIVDGIGRGKPNVYAVTGKFPEDKLRNLLELDDKQKELIRWELGEAALQFIEMDSKMDGLCIELQDPDVDRPGWDHYDY